jgi:hypothetical protein
MADKDDALTIVRLDNAPVMAEGEVENERLSMHTTTRKVSRVLLIDRARAVAVMQPKQF